MTPEQKERSKEAYEKTGCKDCFYKLDSDNLHCAKFIHAPLIVFDEGFCFHWIRSI